MDLKKTITKLVNTPMSRREFLWHIGAAILGLIGISGLIRNLQHNLDRHNSTQTASDSYGSLAYGGKANRKS